MKINIFDNKNINIFSLVYIDKDEEHVIRFFR